MGAPLRKPVALHPPRDLGPYRRSDYESLPDKPRFELIYGRFYLSPSPLVRHQLVVGLLYELLIRIARAHGAVVLMAPMDVHLAAHSIVQPDLFYVSAARRGILKKRVEGAPDLVVEVLSPGTAARDRSEKVRLYADSGVREYWILDPLERRIEIFGNDGRSLAPVTPEPTYHSQALPEVVLEIDEVWRELDLRLQELTGGDD